MRRAARMARDKKLRAAKLDAKNHADRRTSHCAREKMSIAPGSADGALLRTLRCPTPGNRTTNGRLPRSSRPSARPTPAPMRSTPRGRRRRQGGRSGPTSKAVTQWQQNGGFAREPHHASSKERKRLAARIWSPSSAPHLNDLRGGLLQLSRIQISTRAICRPSLMGCAVCSMWRYLSPPHPTTSHSGLYGGVAANPANILCELIASLHTSDGRVKIYRASMDDVVRVVARKNGRFWSRLSVRRERSLAKEIGLARLTGERGFRRTGENVGAPNMRW